MTDGAVNGERVVASDQLVCPHDDPTCPCPDGDVCHYVDDPLSETLAETRVVDAIDCRSDTGILIGLVDGIIAAARVAARSLRTSDRPLADALRHALADLSHDEDVALLTNKRWRFPS